MSAPCRAGSKDPVPVPAGSPLGRQKPCSSCGRKWVLVPKSGGLLNAEGLWFNCTCHTTLLIRRWRKVDPFGYTGPKRCACGRGPATEVCSECNVRKCEGCADLCSKEVPECGHNGKPYGIDP